MTTFKHWESFGPLFFFIFKSAFFWATVDTCFPEWPCTFTTLNTITVLSVHKLSNFVHWLSLLRLRLQQDVVTPNSQLITRAPSN